MGDFFEEELDVFDDDAMQAMMEMEEILHNENSVTPNNLNLPKRVGTYDSSELLTENLTLHKYHSDTNAFSFRGSCHSPSSRPCISQDPFPLISSQQQDEVQNRQNISIGGIMFEDSSDDEIENTSSNDEKSAKLMDFNTSNLIESKISIGGVSFVETDDDEGPQEYEGVKKFSGCISNKNFSKNEVVFMDDTEFNEAKAINLENEKIKKKKINLEDPVLFGSKTKKLTSSVLFEDSDNNYENFVFAKNLTPKKSFTEASLEINFHSMSPKMRSRKRSYEEQEFFISDRFKKKNEETLFSSKPSKFVKHQSSDEENANEDFTIEDKRAVKFAQNLSRQLHQNNFSSNNDFKLVKSKDFTVKPKDAIYYSVHMENGEKFYFPKIIKKKINFDRYTTNCSITESKNLNFGNIPNMIDTSLQDKTSEILLKENIQISGNPLRTTLWVNKYAPKQYIDLIGNESLNRKVLNWVKHWDQCSFGKKIKKKKIKTNKLMLTESDPYGRPFKKILLISGRAGLGKTTLAHVIGKHAGYNIVEINASDDRTGEVLKNKLQGALTNRNINNGKPNLIVIDEIDGASQTGGDQSFMKFLTDLVNNDGKTGSAAFDAAGIKKKMKRATRITRPIICICNDLYAPVLKTLRAIAEIVIIPSPAPLQALSKRLEEICKLEGLRTDIHSLMQLCLITDGDLRSCLNTLQFAYSKISTIEKKEKKKKRFDVDFIEKLDIGLKDMEKNFFFILEELFTLPINSKKNASVEHGKFIQRLFKLIISNDDIERLIQGIFENYLSSLNSNAMSNLFQISKSHSDSASSRIDAALDWLSFYDILDSKVNQNPSCFGLKVYLPYSLISFHHFFASSFKRNNLVYPKADYQNYLKRKNLENILNEFNSSMELKSKLLWGFNNSRELYNKAGSSQIKIFLEFIPYLLKIISPELKGYNLVLMNAKDKSAVKKLVDIMCSNGLMFVQEKQNLGVYDYKLQPPIEQLIEFSDFLTPKKTSSFFKKNPKIYNTALVKTGHQQTILRFSYGLKQILSLEIEKERLRRLDHFMEKKIKRNIEYEAHKQINGKESDETLDSAVNLKPRVTAPKIVTNIEPVKIESIKPLRDFFGRIIKIEEIIETDTEKSFKSEKLKNTVLYKYNEGFSNAVRKPVLIKDFF